MKSLVLTLSLALILTLTPLIKLLSNWGWQIFYRHSYSHVLLCWYPDMRRSISQECGVYWKGTEGVSCGQEASFESMRGMRCVCSGGGSRGPDRTYSSTQFSFSYQSNFVIFVSPTIATVQWNIMRRHHRLLLLLLSSGIGFFGEVLPEVNPSPP